MKNKPGQIVIAVLVLVSLLAAAGAVSAEDIILWGKQTRGWGATNAKTETEPVTLAKPATIIKVEGSAESYCIWSQGRSVLCGGKNQSIVGRTLSPGRYTVLAGLNGQSSAEVRIYLQED